MTPPQRDETPQPPKLLAGQPIAQAPDKKILIEQTENQIKQLELNIEMAKAQLKAIRIWKT